MSFSGFADFLAMGTHGPYVWSAYGLTCLVLLLNIGLPWYARVQWLRVQARRLKRESV